MHVPLVDMSGAYLLDDIVEKAEKQGAVVLMTGIQPSVRDTLERLRVLDRIGADNCLDTFEEAVARVEELEQRRKTAVWAG